MDGGGLLPLTPHRTVLSQDARNRRRTMDPPMRSPQGFHRRAHRGTTGDDVIHHDAEPIAPVLGLEGVEHTCGSLIAIQSGKTREFPSESQRTVRKSHASPTGSVSRYRSHRVLTASVKRRAMCGNRHQPDRFCMRWEHVDAAVQQIGKWHGE